MYALTKPRKLFYTMKTIYIIVIRDNLSSEETYNETPGWSAQRRAATVVNVRIPLSGGGSIATSIRQTDTGLTTHRGAILRHALKVRSRVKKDVIQPHPCHDITIGPAWSYKNIFCSKL